MKDSELPARQRLRLRENQVFFVLSVLIGILSGLFAVLFTLGIRGATYVFFGFSPSPARYLLVPTCVSCVTGFLLQRFFPEARGSGVPQVEAAYRLRQGYVPGRVAFGKFLTGVLCIGSGHSMGREGPSVQIGAGLASTVGRWFHLSPARAQSLVPVAAAGALAGAFNTPVAAVLFALEEIIGDMNAPLIGSAVLASVSAVIVERSVLGNNPIFQVPQYRLMHAGEVLAYAVLGIVGGIVSLAFCKGLLAARILFKRLPERTQILQPAMGGVLIGVILIFFPQVLGVGYEFVDQALNGGLLLKTMIVLCVMKLIATIISYSSGNAGGIFSPSLYLGAMAGGAVGMLVHRVAPFASSSPGAFALVGMGAVFAGIVRAPMTSVFMIFELTQDYQVFVPLMIANMISFAISRQFQPTPLYHALLEQDHVHLPRTGLTGSRMMATLGCARDVMTDKFRIVPASATVDHTWEQFANTGEPSLLVGNDSVATGIVTRARLERELRSGRTKQVLQNLAKMEFEHVHPDHSLDIVISRLGKNPGLLPVVSRANAKQVVGVITPKTLMEYVQTNWGTESEEAEPDKEPAA
jgi:CIC family chloride channel protein